MTTNKNNGKKPEGPSWLELQERLYMRQYQKDIIKAWEEGRPSMLMKFRSGTTIITGTKGNNHER